MQTEINAITTTRPVFIIGVNQVGYETGNALITDGRDLPWLQEDSSYSVWTAWAVTYRDVIILDENNLPVDVFNLTTHNLSTTTEYDLLKNLLVSYAQ